MTLTDTILHQLLDRSEQPRRQRVARVRLNMREHPAYFDASNGTTRHETNDTLGVLAQQGVVHLHWRKWEEGNWLTAVDLEPAHRSELYARLKRSPHVEQVAALRALLEQYGESPRAEWHAAFLNWVYAQLDAHRSIAPLVLGDTRHNTELLRALDALAQLRTPILERAFSVRLFADSKRFESLRGAVLTILRRYEPNAALYGDDDGALLRAHFVERAPEYVPLAGALRLQVAGASLDLAPFVPSIALPANTLRAAQIAACPARAVVTVENAASFTELAAHAHANQLIAVYSGGFASPSLLVFLHTLRTHSPGLPFFHWGDLDGGGLRILAHLRKALGDVVLLGMDAATYKVHQTFARPLTASERAALAELRATPRLTDCIPLIETLLVADQKLEQEAVGVEYILKALNKSGAHEPK